MARVVRKGKPFQHVAALHKRAARNGADALVWAKTGKGPATKGKRMDEARKPGAGQNGGGGRVEKSPEVAGSRAAAQREL